MWPAGPSPPSAESGSTFPSPRAAAASAWSSLAMDFPGTRRPAVPVAGQRIIARTQFGPRRNFRAPASATASTVHLRRAMWQWQLSVEHGNSKAGSRVAAVGAAAASRAPPVQLGSPSVPACPRATVALTLASRRWPFRALTRTTFRLQSWRPVPPPDYLHRDSDTA